MCKNNFIVCPADDPGDQPMAEQEVVNRFLDNVRKEVNEKAINWLIENHNIKQYNTMGKFTSFFTANQTPKEECF